MTMPFPQLPLSDAAGILADVVFPKAAGLVQLSELAASPRVRWGYDAVRHQIAVAIQLNGWEAVEDE